MPPRSKYEKIWTLESGDRFVKMMVSRACFGLIGLFALAMSARAYAHVTLSETEFEAGRNFAAFFKVDEGCGASPTVALEVTIPETVILLEVPEKPGWTVRANRVPLSPPLQTERGLIKQRVTAVTWRGRLAANALAEFGLLTRLPPSKGPLYFPAIQRCESGEARWTDIPAPGDTSHTLLHPAPVLNLIPAQDGVAHQRH